VVSAIAPGSIEVYDRARSPEPTFAVGVQCGMCDLRQKVNLNLADAAGTLRDSNVQLLAEVGRLELENRALRKKLAR